MRSGVSAMEENCGKKAVKCFEVMICCSVLEERENGNGKGEVVKILFSLFAVTFAYSVFDLDSTEKLKKENKVAYH